MLGYKNIIEETDFVEIGIELFESEDVTNNLISIYLSIMSNGWIGVDSLVPLPIDMIGNFYTNGLWLSCLPRVAISGQIDIRNDGIPNCSAIPIADDVNFDFVSVQKISALPKPYFSLPGAQALFWAGITRGMSNSDRLLRRKELEPLAFDATYFSLIGDKLFPAKSAEWPNQRPAALLAKKIAAALQTVSDFKSMWVVQTKEETITKILTPLRLGVNAEIIKSLFYARNLPVTESGRKRPILHWVRAHQRRIKDGIDVDITKHLRGITNFEMDGFEFNITNPVKNATKL